MKANSIGVFNLKISNSKLSLTNVKPPNNTAATLSACADPLAIFSPSIANLINSLFE